MSAEVESVLADLEQLRLRWAEIESQLNSGGMFLSDVFANSSEDVYVGSIKLLKCLDALPETRKIDVRRFLDSEGISEQIVVADMADSIRSKVLEQFG